MRVSTTYIRKICLRNDYKKVYGVMKIIFLDVDGVLNSLNDGNSIRLRTDLHLKLLKKIVDATGIKIIQSSSWRIGPIKGRDNLLKLLRDFGL